MTIKHLRTSAMSLGLIALGACGTDSTAPRDLTAAEALQSLTMGLGSAPGAPVPFLVVAPGALGEMVRGGIDGVDVVIDGTTHRMYGLALRVAYPAGTCFETVFLVVSPTGAATCTPPPLGLVLALWQTRSGSRPPDRMVIVSADVGTTNFSSLVSESGDFPIFPAFAIYLNDRQELWTALSGTLTSQVTPTDFACQVPPPPFAGSWTCRFAHFDEAGQITFEKLDSSTLFGPGSSGTQSTMELVIPRQTIGGILQSVSEIVVPGPWDY